MNKRVTTPEQLADALDDGTLYVDCENNNIAKVLAIGTIPEVENYLRWQGRPLDSVNNDSLFREFDCDSVEDVLSLLDEVHDLAFVVDATHFGQYPLNCMPLIASPKYLDCFGGDLSSIENALEYFNFFEK